jgi:hypothetical protein
MGIPKQIRKLKNYPGSGYQRREFERKAMDKRK